jgi:hypothetical protein
MNFKAAATKKDLAPEEIRPVVERLKVYNKSFFVK